ncbi:CRE-PHY-4 protein [Aphelenchoides avenae]|nr:CRE-PHY-4 protein [Aphelenchus avenae]
MPSGTVFPNAELIFAPQPGDAILWFNALPTSKRVEGSLHGACPVLKGSKVGLTLWLREKGNELRMPCPTDESVPYSLERLVRPKWQSRDKAALKGGYLDEA